MCRPLLGRGEIKNPPPGYTATEANGALGVYNSKVADDAKVEFSKAVLEAELVNKCLDECDKMWKTDETAQEKLYLELPLKADGSKTVKFDGDFRPRPNIPIFMKLWCD